MRNKDAKPKRLDGKMPPKDQKGPITKAYNPEEGEMRQFKGGAKFNKSETLCKNRYQ